MLRTVSEIPVRDSPADSLTTDQAHVTFLPYSSPINGVISAAPEERKAALCFRADILQTWLVALVVVLIRYLLNFGSLTERILLCRL